MYALINLVSMYNDRLLASQAESVTESDDAVLDGARWALTTLGSVDVVVEMVGTLSNGRAGKWKAVSVLS